MNKKIGFLCILVFALCFGVSGLSETKEVFASVDEKEIIKLSDKVYPYLSFEGYTDAEIKVMTILESAKAKKVVDMEEIDPDNENYNEVDLKEYEKASKKLFGKVIPLGLKGKIEGKFQSYYDKKTKTIYQAVFYDPGDVTIKRNKRTVKKLTNNTFVVENLDSSYHPLSLDKRPTKKMEVFIKKTKKGYLISDIKLTNISDDTVKLGEEDVKNQIKNIKKWFAKQPKDVVRKDFKKDDCSYTTLRHKHNIVFIYEKYGVEEKRYYYKDGIPVRVMESENGKVVYQYDLTLDKNGNRLLNGKEEFDDDWEEAIALFAGADNAYYWIEKWEK